MRAFPAALQINAPWMRNGEQKCVFSVGKRNKCQSGHQQTPQFANSSRRPGGTTTDPWHLRDGQAVPGEAGGALCVGPRGWQPLRPSPWQQSLLKMSPSQRRPAGRYCSLGESPDRLHGCGLPPPHPSPAEGKGRGQQGCFTYTASAGHLGNSTQQQYKHLPKSAPGSVSEGMLGERSVQPSRGDAGVTLGTVSATGPCAAPGITCATLWVSPQPNQCKLCGKHPVERAPPGKIWRTRSLGKQGAPAVQPRGASPPSSGTMVGFVPSSPPAPAGAGRPKPGEHRRHQPWQRHPWGTRGSCPSTGQRGSHCAVQRLSQSFRSQKPCSCALVFFFKRSALSPNSEELSACGTGIFYGVPRGSLQPAQTT